MRYHLPVLLQNVKVYLGALSFFIIISSTAFGQDGETLFKANCAACHKIDAKLVGPALAGVEDRWESRDNLKSWILNSQQYLKDNPSDGYAQALYEEYNKTMMPAVALNDAEVEAILGYIANPPAPAEPAVAESAEAPSTPQKDTSVIWLMALALVSLIVVFVLLNIKRTIKGLLVEVLDEEKLAELGEVDDTQWTRKERFRYWVGQNTKTYIAGLGLVGLIVLYTLWNGIFGIGVFEGYAPEQPIKFSHQIHSGEAGIDCTYCHWTAEKGKTAGIPPVNVCMNCHRGIQKGRRWGTEEIAKIYEAAGWNPAKGDYDSEGKPIEWIRIHNLPDHAYFNHSQHVIVGKIECQTCHGEVEEYDYPMKQFAPLTMGWCIDCHRETDVKMANNGYYDKLHEQLVEKYKQEGTEVFKVSQIGGMECAKCHY
ncbi:MAG TPA: cytochrome C [Flavobacteriales bacterium]|jgi:cytochrome c551/c552|nr:cytochrome C [Flavobacteriales bacterium]